MSGKIYFYPIWLRIWHAINALMFLVLIVTGISMQYATASAHTIIKFNTAVTIHNVAGWILVIDYLFFFFSNFVTKNWRFYKIQFAGFVKRLIAQMKYYIFGIFKGEKAPFPTNEERKFNPLQQFTYVSMMYICFPILMVTGLAMMYPQVIPDQILGMSGFVLSDLLHIVMGFFGSVFLVIHVYFCTIGASPTANFKSMLNGWHEAHE